MENSIPSGPPTVGATNPNTSFARNFSISLINQRLMQLVKLPNLIKAGIACATISFLCFVFGDRSDVAVGGLIGELIAYGSAEWRNSFQLLKYGKNIGWLLKSLSVNKSVIRTI